MYTQPCASPVVVGIRFRHEAPVVGRVVESAQVHQLVNHEVVAYPLRHQRQPPVQCDVTIASA